MSTPPGNLPFDPSVDPTVKPSSPFPQAPSNRSSVPTPSPVAPPSIPPVSPFAPPMAPPVPPSAPAPRPVAPPEIKAMPPRATSSREPEDMFSDVDVPAASPPKTVGAMAPLPVHRTGLMKYLIIGVGVLLVLSLVGFVFWYVAVRSSKIPVVVPTVEIPVQPTSSFSVTPPPEVPSNPVVTPTMNTQDSSTTAMDVSSTLPVPVTTPPPGVNIPLPATNTTSAVPVLVPEPVSTTIDTDQDGLTDQRELELGTNPKIADTDGDGLSDGDEVLKYGTNPLNPDTDGDGYKDGAEVEKEYNPVGAGKCANPGCLR